MATSVYDKERTLTREISDRVERGLPGVEVLAVELIGSDRFCVYVDHAQGVDHALCARVTGELREYLREYSIDVSSPGIDRPLRRPEHFRSVVGRRVSLKTSAGIDGRKNFRGALKSAGERSVTVAVDGSDIDIPYDSIVRANLISESR
ncbi:MAG: ribosome maturation factor RimP [Gaiellaceae bacterium]|jgi:ribosome maturation factor RimP|nr:ribosome maturation factor RimP [Acidobacteriota bacterium]